MTRTTLLWAAALCLSACACGPKPMTTPVGNGHGVRPLPPVKRSAVELDGTSLPVRVLTTEPARTQGLAALSRDEAKGVLLLRVYPRPLYIGLTNTGYRLRSELAWINAGGTVVRVDRLHPDEGLPEDQRVWSKSPARVQYVLEALDGALADAGVQTGTTLAIRADVATGAAELPTPPRRTLTLTVGGQEVTAEIASTVPQRRHGLMLRNSLPPNHGMLFIYPSAQERGFWMKNCAMDLDIAYTTAGGTIVSVHTMKAAWHTPDSVDLPGYPSGGACTMALEMESGWFQRHGVEAGHTLELPANIGELQRTADR